MEHPWKLLIEQIRDRGWTQKQFSVLVWKKNSEVNELIKWKRNITVWWDLKLSEILGTPEKYWINLQVEYDYQEAKKVRAQEKSQKESENIPEIVSEIWSIDSSDSPKQWWKVIDYEIPAIQTVSNEWENDNKQIQEESIKDSPEKQPDKGKWQEIESHEYKVHRHQLKQIFWWF